MKTINLGGKDSEQLFLYHSQFKSSIDRNVMISVCPTETNPNSDLSNLISRHKGRYGFISLFLRPNHKILDFPCGSGYGSSVLLNISREFKYEGRDINQYVIEYANYLYKDKDIKFKKGDLRHPVPTKTKYNVIACLEGLEHIESKYQLNLIKYFYKHLVKNGILIISSPGTCNKQSGKSLTNPYHLCELTQNDFYNLLESVFTLKNVEVISLKEKLDDGQIHNCFYGVCHK